MSSDRQFEKWLEGHPSTDQVRSRLDDYTTKIQDIARVALDPDSAPFAEAKVKRVRANSNQPHPAASPENRDPGRMAVGEN